MVWSVRMFALFSRKGVTAMEKEVVAREALTFSADTGLNLGDEGVYELLCNGIGVDAGERPQDVLQGLFGLDGLVNVVRREHGL